MPPEILALIDKPLSLIAVLFVGALMGMFVEQAIAKQRRSEWRKRNGRRWAGDPKHRSPQSAPKPDPLPLATTQLETVMRAEFKPRALLNRSEQRVLLALDKAVEEAAPHWRVMAQVSLGEILASPCEEAYRAVNSKRVDMLLVDDDYRPVHAIEFQGQGHHQGSAAARDAIKREALRRAGIGYVEVKSGDTPAELRRVITRLAGTAKTSA
ncbi:MAG: DUF2726 domain-containing protein [Sphingomonadaceae bacterium]